MDYAFQYINDNGGIDTENSYPYEAKYGRCRYDSQNSRAKNILGFIDIERGNEEDLRAAVATIGPISAAIDASSRWMQHHGRGK